MECTLFYTELSRGIYRISDSLHGPNSDGFSDAPGRATQNSYLIQGQERAALIDLAVDTPDLFSYACQLTGLPTQVLLTHGHPDHVYNLESVGEAWLHPDDYDLVLKGIPGICFPIHNVVLNPLKDRQKIDLGERILEVIHMPGHTLGSVLFWDKLSGFLFSGDSCSRRLLYGLTPTVPLDEHCKKIAGLAELPINHIYTAHDRCGLPKAHLLRICELIRQELPKSATTVIIPGIGIMRNLRWGDENTLDYFDMAVEESYVEGLLK